MLQSKRVYGFDDARKHTADPVGGAELTSALATIDADATLFASDFARSAVRRAAVDL